jgi:hypothetical protein
MTDTLRSLRDILNVLARFSFGAITVSDPPSVRCVVPHVVVILDEWVDDCSRVSHRDIVIAEVGFVGIGVLPS